MRVSEAAARRQVLLEITAPYWSPREVVRLRHDLGRIPYFEVHAATLLEVCSGRDVTGEPAGPAGVHDPYEEPETHDPRMESQHQTVQESSASVYALLSAGGPA
ncbi:adenylyl-sulfate kinase [Streptomyces sp. NPDC048416]|uniref:adenylyl-sulfate kinase n=1 Tax=Streptomyces sp. NPDC048416 TaxID=3365546 RepID=UPI00371F32C7